MHKRFFTFIVAFFLLNLTSSSVSAASCSGLVSSLNVQNRCDSTTSTNNSPSSYTFAEYTCEGLDSVNTLENNNACVDLNSIYRRAVEACRLACKTQSPSPLVTASPSPGCYYQDVMCINPPCHPVQICPSPTTSARPDRSPLPPQPITSAQPIISPRPGCRIEKVYCPDVVGYECPPYREVCPNSPSPTTSSVPTISPSPTSTTTSPTPSTTKTTLNLKLEPTCNTITYEWTNVDHNSGYQIELSEYSDFRSLVTYAILPKNTTETTFYNLKSGTNYYARLSLTNIPNYPQYNYAPGAKTKCEGQSTPQNPSSTPYASAPAPSTTTSSSQTNTQNTTSITNKVVKVIENLILPKKNSPSPFPSNFTDSVEGQPAAETIEGDLGETINPPLPPEQTKQRPMSFIQWLVYQLRRLLGFE